MKTLMRIAALAALVASFEGVALAQSESVSFKVSVIIPQQLELAAPQRLRGYENTPEALLMRHEDFFVGPRTNLRRQVDVSVQTAERMGRLTRLVTLTAL